MLNVSRWESEACVGNVGSIPRLGFRSLCMQDSPLGVRDSTLWLVVTNSIGANAGVS
jgi:hypothetical protein